MRRSVTATVVGVAAITLLSACSGGSARSTSPATEAGVLAPHPSRPATTAPPPSAAPTTTAAPTPVTAVAPRPGWSDTTPPPRLHNTGTNYPRIVASLLAYRDWLFAHHPDSKLAANIYVPGVTGDSIIPSLDHLRAAHQTVVSVGKHAVFEVASVVPAEPYIPAHAGVPAQYGRYASVSGQLHETLVSHQLLDSAHHLVRTDPFPDPVVINVVIDSDGKGHWLISRVVSLAGSDADLL